VRRKIYLWKKADIYKIKEDLESFGNTFPYFILNFLLESFISIDISFLLVFSSFLMSILLPVDLSPDGCIDPRMCVSPLCHFRKIYLWKKADIYKIKEDLESFGNTFRNIGKRDIESLFPIDGSGLHLRL
jgi:hypothetical protein